MSGPIKRIRLENHKGAVRNASLMDDDTLAKAEALAAEHGMQLIPEIVKQGQPLTIVIEDDGHPDAIDDGGW